LILRGEIYLSNLGQERGLGQAGIRPVLVIQNDAGNASSDTTIVASLTTHRFSAGYPFHVEVTPRESGLRERSTILLEQIQTLSIDRLGRRIGQLAPNAMAEVDEAIHASLGLID
jgi:mRNA interferase MazF